MVRSRLMGWFALAGVGCGYAPDSFQSRHGFPGVRQTVGCLDIAVLGQRDAVTQNPLLEINVGNRCDHGVDVDLGALQVRGKTATHDVALTAVDPRQEIRVLRMDGRLVGREVIEYRATEAPTALVALCVDASRVERTARGHQRWTCMTLEGAR